MKIAIAIAAQESLPHLLFSGKLEEGLDKIAHMGYEGVELSIRNPNQLDINKISELIQKNKLEVSAIGTGLTFTIDGLSFSHSNKNVRSEAVERIKNHIDFAYFFQSKILIGYVKGPLSHEIADRKVQKEWIKSCLKECAQFALKKKVTLLLEMINKFESGFLNTIAEGAKFIENLGEDNVKLLIDTFHMNIEESSNYGAIVEGNQLIDYVHLADNNRMYPGAGQIDFSKVISALRKIGYEGYLTTEVVPKPSDEVAAQMSIKNIKSFLALIDEK